VNSKWTLGLLFGVLLNGCAGEAAKSGDASDGSEPLEESSSPLCKKALSPAREKLALALIDDICGDTWCEGDNDFAFDHLSCELGAPGSSSAGSCTLKLRILPRDDSHRSYPRSCTASGFMGFDSIVETASSGYQSLNWDYYLALTECISQLEAALPH